VVEDVTEDEDKSLTTYRFVAVNFMCFQVAVPDVIEASRECI
jgi:hypothetical protein